MSPNLSRITIIALVASVLFSLFLADRACNVLPKKLQEADAKYQAYRALSVEQHKQSDALIAKLTEDNIALASETVALKKDIATNKETISAQSQTIAQLQANEPPTTAEVEAMPIVINLRAQVRALTEGFSLARQTIAEQDKVILNLTLSNQNLERIVVEWQAKFNREQSLRLAAESLNLGYKKQISGMHLTSTIKNVVIGGLVVGVVAGLVRN